MIPSTVCVGGKSKLELLEALRVHHVQFNGAAEALFAHHRFTTLGQRMSLSIVSLSVSELGFASGATYDQLLARARDLGLAECPLETGPQLRLHLLSQPDTGSDVPDTPGQAPPGSITVASSPLDERDETPKGFYLSCVDSVLWLRGYWSCHGHIWDPYDVFVLARANKQQLLDSEGPSTPTPKKPYHEEN